MGNGLGRNMQVANEIASLANSMGGGSSRSSFLPDPIVFRKGGSISDSIHEEPTLASFFFVFHFDDTASDIGSNTLSSPLFAPARDSSGKPYASASNFFEHTVSNADPDYGADKLAKLNSFKSILKKVNSEMPWVFQSITGLELARQYNDEEPWRGVDKPKIEIECLEENIEFMITKMMSLYRNIVWDDKRNIRIMPTNISKFTVDVYVTEIRGFQANTGSPFLGSYRGSGDYKNLSNQEQDSRNADQIYAKGFIDKEYTAIKTGITKPVFVVRLKHCEFDMNSGQEIFAELSKNPEYKKPKIGIYYKTAEILHENGGPNLPLDKKLKEVEVISTGGTNISRNPYDPGDDKPKIVQALVGMGKDIADSTVSSVGGALARLRNATKIFNGNSIIGNVHGVGLSGAAENLVEGLVPDFGSLFLGNVHGVNDAGTLQDAINSASLNALGIFNQGSDLGAIKDQFGADAVKDETIQPANIYDNLNVGGGLQSPTPNLSNVYDGINPNTLDSTPDIGIKDNVYGSTPAIDSTPDGNLNQNVYE